MMLKRTVALAGATLVGLALAACSGVPAATEAQATTLGRVSTIEEVRDAFIEAGGVCNWKQTDVVLDATASGTCSEQTVIMLFANQDDREAIVTRMQSLGMDSLTLLVGDNWVINSPEAEEMQSVLGGNWIPK